MQLRQRQNHPAAHLAQAKPTRPASARALPGRPSRVPTAARRLPLPSPPARRTVFLLHFHTFTLSRRIHLRRGLRARPPRTASRFLFSLPKHSGREVSRHRGTSEKPTRPAALFRRHTDLIAPKSERSSESRMPSFAARNACRKGRRFTLRSNAPPKTRRTDTPNCGAEECRKNGLMPQVFFRNSIRFQRRSATQCLHRGRTSLC